MANWQIRTTIGICKTDQTWLLFVLRVSQYNTAKHLVLWIILNLSTFKIKINIFTFCRYGQDLTELVTPHGKNKELHRPGSANEIGGASVKTKQDWT